MFWFKYMELLHKLTLEKITPRALEPKRKSYETLLDMSTYQPQSEPRKGSTYNV